MPPQGVSIFALSGSSTRSGAAVLAWNTLIPTRWWQTGSPRHWERRNATVSAASLAWEQFPRSECPHSDLPTAGRDPGTLTPTPTLPLPFPLDQETYDSQARHWDIAGEAWQTAVSMKGGSSIVRYLLFEPVHLVPASRAVWANLRSHRQVYLSCIRGIGELGYRDGL